MAQTFSAVEVVVAQTDSLGYCLYDLVISGIDVD
jgi:hypothetical protein